MELVPYVGATVSVASGQTASAAPSKLANTNSEATVGDLPPSLRVPPKDVQLFTDISDWANAKRLFVSKSDQTAVLYAESRGWPVEVSSTTAGRIHPISHVSRDLVFLEILKREGKGLREMRILDWYGAPRNKTLTPRFPPNGMVNVGTSRIPCWIRSREALNIEIVCAPETVVQGDIGRWRGGGRVALKTSDEFDTCIIQDVYFDSLRPKEALSPDTIKMLARYVKSGEVYVCCRMFNGEAGSDDFRSSVPDADTNLDFEEGVWNRDSETGWICFYPDPTSPPYALHPDVNWLQYRHFQGVDSTYVTQIGPYSVFRCAINESATLKLARQIEPTPLVSRVDIHTVGEMWRYVMLIPGMSSFLTSLGLMTGCEGTISVLVCHSVACRYATVFNVRLPNGPTLDVVQMKIKSELECLKPMKEIRHRFPERYQEIVDGTVLYVLYASRENTAQRLARLRGGFAMCEDKIVKARATTNAWTASVLRAATRRRWATKVAVGSVAVGFVWLLSRGRGGTSGNSLGLIERGLGCVFKLTKGLVKFVFRPFSIPTTFYEATLKDRYEGNLNHDMYPLIPACVRDCYRYLSNCIIAPVYNTALDAYTMYGGRGEAFEAVQNGLLSESDYTNCHPDLHFYNVFVAPLLEETARFVIPITGELIRWFETFMHANRGDAKASLTSNLFHATMNKIQAKQTWTGYFVALGIHVSWNAFITLIAIKSEVYSRLHYAEQFMNMPVNGHPSSIPVASLLETFMKTRSDALQENLTSGVMTLTADVVIPPYTSQVMVGPPEEKFRGAIKISVDDVPMTVEEALEVLSIDPKEDNCIYPILITNGLLWEPANNEKNLLTAILWRTHLNPFNDKYPESLRHRNWAALASTFRSLDLFRRVVFELPSFKDCLDLMGKRGERIARANQRDQMGDNARLWKTISLKWNETLNNNKDIGGVRTLKPRAIVNLDAIIHARMTRYARACAAVLHERMNGQVIQMYGVQVRIFFAAGYNQADLNAVGDALASGDTVIAISGDDSVVAWGPLAAKLGLESYGECDQSQFDHTQDDGPQYFAAREWMSLIGLPEEFFDLCYFCCSSPYTAKYRRLKVIGKAETQMPTGITMTTVLNTMSTLFMYMWMIMTRSKDISESAAQLGFSTKYKGSDDLGQITFLRGWWRLTADLAGRVWLPLPSACIKLGKVLRDPVDICKIKDPVSGRVVYRSYEESVRVVAYALASSYKLIPADYPIFGPFLMALRRAGVEMTHPDLHSLSESWKPKLVETDIDVVDAEEAICLRYGLQVEDIDRVSKLLNRVSKVPGLIVDPVFDRFKETDY